MNPEAPYKVVCELKQNHPDCTHLDHASYIMLVEKIYKYLSYDVKNFDQELDFYIEDFCESTLVQHMIEEIYNGVECEVCSKDFNGIYIVGQQPYIRDVFYLLLTGGIEI